MHVLFFSFPAVREEQLLRKARGYAPFRSHCQQLSPSAHVGRNSPVSAMHSSHQSVVVAKTISTPQKEGFKTCARFLLKCERVPWVLERGGGSLQLLHVAYEPRLERPLPGGPLGVKGVLPVHSCACIAKQPSHIALHLQRAIDRTGCWQVEFTFPVDKARDSYGTQTFGARRSRSCCCLASAISFSSCFTRARFSFSSCAFLQRT
jgi:hypothetical protein